MADTATHCSEKALDPFNNCLHLNGYFAYESHRPYKSCALINGFRFQSQLTRYAKSLCGCFAFMFPLVFNFNVSFSATYHYSFLLLLLFFFSWMMKQQFCGEAAQLSRHYKPLISNVSVWHSHPIRDAKLIRIDRRSANTKRMEESEATRENHGTVTKD